MSIWTDKAGRKHVGVMLNGRRVHRVLAKDATANDAKRIESEIRAAVGSRSPQIPGAPTMTQVLGLYLTHADTLRSPETAKKHALRLGPWIAGYQASDARRVASIITRDMLKKYKPATINRSLGAMSKALRLAWETGYLAQDYSGHIKRLREGNQRDVVVTLAEVKKLADASTEQVRAAIWIAIYTGCRRGEICSMQQADIGATSITLRAGNTKTLKTRVIPIVSAVRPWLAYIPLTINFEGLKSGFERARIKVGLPHVNFHDLRRSCASMMIESGVDLYVVSKLLGHSSVAVTQARYAHMQIEQVARGLEKTFG